MVRSFAATYVLDEAGTFRLTEDMTVDFGILLFEEYLPYAIVYGCVTKWAEAFEGLGLEGRQVGWYVGTHGFVPVQFAESLGDFSSSISGVMASTPAVREAVASAGAALREAAEAAVGAGAGDWGRAAE